MGIIIRQSFKALLVQYLGVVLGYVNIIFLFPLCLPLEEMGLVRFVLEMGVFLAFFAQIGIPNAINRFYPYFRSADRKDNGFQFLIFLVPLLGIATFTLLFIFLRPLFEKSFIVNSPLVLSYFWYFIPFTIVFVYLNVLEQYIATQLRIVVPKLIRDVYLRLLTAILLVLVYVKVIDFQSLLPLLVIVYFTAVVFNFYYIYKIKGLDLRPNFSALRDSNLVKEIIRFLSYIIIAGIGSTIVNKIDGYMVSSLINLSSFSIYSTALFIATVIEMPYRSISQISSPIIAEAMKSNDKPKILEIYRKSSINQFIIGSFIFVMIWLNVDILFDMMPNSEAFRAGKYVILFVGLSKVFDLLTGINALILGNSKFYYFGLYFMFILAAVAISLNYLLIPHWNITGVAIATATSILLYNSMLTLFVYAKMKIHPFTKHTGKVALFFALTFSLHAVANNYTISWYYAIIETVLFVIAFFIFLKIVKPSDEIDLAINEFSTRIRKLI